MSNEYNNMIYLYDYMIRSMVSFFSDKDKKLTSRYVLYFDSASNIAHFMKRMQEMFTNNDMIVDMRKRLGVQNLNVEVLQDYEIKNDAGLLEYSAMNIRFINGEYCQTVVYIPDYDEDGKELGDAFKNSIRNKFVDEREDKILFYISIQNIASVEKTTENFQKPGRPLCVSNVYDDLYNKISNVDGENEKETLKFSLESIRRNKPETDNSLTEFAAIMRIVENKALKKDDFHDLHLFPMDMADIGKKGKELISNYKLFRDINLAIEDQEIESYLSGYVDKLTTRIKRLHEQYGDEWDRHITYETIEQHKKSSQKKFKVESVIAKDRDNVELSGEYYLKPDSGTMIFFTRKYSGEKKFYVEIKCTQKATVNEEKTDFVVHANSRGTTLKVCLDRSEENYLGKVMLLGGRENKRFTLEIIVMNTTSNFLPDSFKGIKKKRNALYFNFETMDYTLCFDGEGPQCEIEIDPLDISSVPYSINSQNNTVVNFKDSMDDESIDECNLAFLIDDDFKMNSIVRFGTQSLRTLKVCELFNKCNIERNTYSVNSETIVNVYQRSDKFKVKEFTVAGKSYPTDKLFYIERELVAKKIKFAKVNGLGNFQEIFYDIPKTIIEKYDAMCEYFLQHNTSPSLCPYDSEKRILYQGYIAEIMKYISKESEHFKHGNTLREEIHNILYLGTLTDSDGFVWMTPLSPLSVAYQYGLYERKEEIVEFDEELYFSLGFGNLLPFLKDTDGRILQAVKGDYPIQWACYYDSRQAVKGDMRTYLEKISDYYDKFSYLFQHVSNNMFIINIVGIYHSQELINALIGLYKKKVDFRRLKFEINYYYSGLGKNELDNMTMPEYVRKRAERSFAKREQELVDGFCEWYMENVLYYAIKDEGNYKYSHITFCAMQSDSQKNKTNAISRAKSGIMLGGMVSDIPSCLDKESGFYKYGFGAQYIDEILDNELLCRVAAAFNELAYCEMGSSIVRDSSIAMAVQNTKSEKLKEVYKASNWVVFVEPKIDLDFFINQEENDKDLIIIHYPDKNVTSSGYSSITVTQKSQQYIDVIREYLELNLTQYDKNMDIKKVIKNYNAYSGAWLMTYIKNNESMKKEKISLVSAIRFCLQYFSKISPEYIWIPLGLDEILRVTGSIGGTKTKCLFSKEALIKRNIVDRTNVNSDDILMAGIRISDKGIFVVYIPVEVKYGQVSADIKQKAHKQSVRTMELLQQSFVDDLSDGEQERIDKTIYRNYMMQHVISNIEKMVAYGIVDGEREKYEILISSKERVKLLNDLYTIETSAGKEPYAFYFIEGRKSIERQKNATDNVIEILAPYRGMFEYLIDDEILSSAVEFLNNEELAIDSAQYDILDIDFEEEEDEGEKIADKEFGEIENFQEISSGEKALDVSVKLRDYVNEKGEDYAKELLQNARVLIGKDKAGNLIYWEFGNKNLANRHLLITGTSGQGKTYSIQTMLYELEKVNVPAIIFDYTEGFRKDQLESPFVEEMGEKIKERFFYFEGVPVNPFIRHDIDIGGNIMKEKAADVASRLADIFTHVYDLGEQQSSAIFKAVVNGINTYGDSMNMEHFRQELDDVQQSNKTAKTVISKMEPFFQSISFEYKSGFDWGKVLYGEEAFIHIFQLTGINREMQVIVTELMLWDAWYYTKKYGKKEKPFVVVLDEAQNLSHKKNSPSAVILTEGRKFGWSAWFATQSLKILKDEEVVRLLQAAFKLYFKPTDEEVIKTARQLDPTGENNWTSEVKRLKKGECIVAGDRVKSNGEFGGTQPLLVSVVSFEERIHM